MGGAPNNLIELIQSIKKHLELIPSHINDTKLNEILTSFNTSLSDYLMILQVVPPKPVAPSEPVESPKLVAPSGKRSTDSTITKEDLSDYVNIDLITQEKYMLLDITLKEQIKFILLNIIQLLYSDGISSYSPTGNMGSSKPMAETEIKFIEKKKLLNFEYDEIAMNIEKLYINVSIKILFSLEMKYKEGRQLTINLQPLTTPPKKWDSKILKKILDNITDKLISDIHDNKLIVINLER